MKKIFIICICLLIYLCNISLAANYVKLIKDDGGFVMMEVKDFLVKYGITEKEFMSNFGNTAPRGTFSATYSVSTSQINDYINSQESLKNQVQPVSNSDFAPKSVQELANEYSNEENNQEPEGDAEHEICGQGKHKYVYMFTNPESFKCNSYNEVDYYCIKCGLSGGTGKLFFGHKWQDSNVVGKEATCSTPGYYAIECSVCKTINKDVAGRKIPIKPDNHVLEPGDIIYRPTCMSNGYRAKICTVCGKKFGMPYGEIVPSGPDYHVWVLPEKDGPRDIPVTCQRDGWRYVQCSICQQYSNSIQRIVPKSDHVYIVKNDALPEVEPTCTEKGWKYIAFCQWCNIPEKGFTEILPAKGHYYTETKINDTYHKKECNRCGDKIDKEKHTLKELKNLRIDPTCSKAGQSTYACSCGYQRKKEIAATGVHSYEDWTITKSATCTTSGTMEGKCSMCGKKTTEKLPAIGHNWGSYVITRAPTATVSGAKTSTCSRCEAKKVITIPKLPKATVPPGGTENLLK